jgi:poly-gamma-glutamate synthesis protein (capsule biosynthesis protein)
MMLLRRAPLLLIVAAALLGGCREGDTSFARIESLLAVESITGTQAALTAFGDELAAVMPAARLERTDSAAAALEVLRSGRAVAAFVRTDEAQARDGLTLTEIDAQPVAAFVPFTFPLEGVSSAHLREIAAGRATTWREAGGPALPVDLAARDPAEITSALALSTRAVPVVDVAAALADRRDRVVFAAGTAAGPSAKALRVDGLLPGDEGYPFTIRWLLAGRTGDERVTALARTLAGKGVQRGAEVVLDAVGDIMLGREVSRVIAARGQRYPFEAAAPLFAGSDLRVGNLELPLTERGTPARKDYVFRAPPAVADGLTWAGFNLLTLANNHTLDYGQEGLLDTLAALDRSGIAHVGAGRTAAEAHRPILLTVRGLRIAVLSYVNVSNDSRSNWQAESMKAGQAVPGVAWGTPEAIRRDVAAARPSADVVIVAIHAGWEYTPTPNPTQRALAYAAVDAGATLVLGAHPHVLQGIELYRGVPIVYSLGNFIFDLDDDDRSQPGLPSLLTAVLRVRLDRAGVRSLEVRPAVIDPRDGRPVPVTGAAARPVYERLYSLTDALSAGR